MKLMIVGFVLVMAITIIILLIMGIFNYIDDKKNGYVVSFLDEVEDAFDEAFISGPLPVPIYGLFIAIILIGLGAFINVKAYSPDGQYHQEKILLEKMAVYDDKYVHKTGNTYDFMEKGTGSIDNAPKYTNSTVKFHNSKSYNYLIIKYDTFRKKTIVPKCLIDGWANREGEKHIVSYDFYTN